ncbi:hypothetical protein [Blastococcus sp. CT_GayMR16]|uniref:hypothetical protein n=1 Tax=Blastococcus sp. CT_GayMR16 TaxID=2559607 RepID=UPI0010737CD6|nr:hypothetical protein [Blastococcus sp. CT_GayMR16]TFV89193.1 hypothetical protein E4P38_08605 [Blastococcus sp. CT_GayMR16]
MTVLRRLLRSILNSPAVTLGIASVGAVSAAVIKQLVGPTWDWVDFWQDVVQNAFIAVAITFLTTYVVTFRLRREQAQYVLDRLEVVGGAVFGEDRVPTGSGPQEDVVKKIKGEAAQFQQAADDLDEILDVGERRSDMQGATDDEKDLIKFVQLSRTRFGFVRYLNEGGRKRRPVWARLLVDDLASLESAADRELAQRAHSCRLLAMEFVGWIQHTDTVITERLVVELTTPLLADVRAPLGGVVEATYERNPEMVLLQIEPMYLLIHHIWSADQAIRTDLAGKAHLIPPLLDSVRRCLGAFRNELRIATELADSLILLVARARVLVRDS